MVKGSYFYNGYTIYQDCGVQLLNGEWYVYIKGVRYHNPEQEVIENIVDNMIDN